MTFEPRLDARDLRDSSGSKTRYPTVATIWGSLTSSSAFLSGVAIDSYIHPIPSMWRFGRDRRHSVNGGIGDGRCTVTNLRRTQISSDQETKKNTETPHASSQKRVRDGVRNFSTKRPFAAHSCDKAIRGVPVPMVEIATAPPYTSCLTVVETAPAVDGNNRYSGGISKCSDHFQSAKNDRK